MYDLVQAPAGPRRRASSPATRRGTAPVSTSSRRRCARRTPSSSPRRRCCRLLEVAREAYDIVVVDTSPFFYGPMLAVLAADRPAADAVRARRADAEERASSACARSSSSASRASRTNLVLNRVTPEGRAHAARTSRRCSALEVSFEIPNDPVVAPAVNRGAVAGARRAATPSSPRARRAHRAHARPPATCAGVVQSVEAPKRRWLTPRRVLEGRAS